MLTADLRASLLDRLQDLAPGADVSALVAFWNEHEADCRGEFSAVPGHDQVRAGLIRLLPAVVDEADRPALLAAAKAAVDALDPAALDGVTAMRRHPAWTALCLLELGEQGVGDDPLGRAIELATLAFATVSPDDPRGRGEVLWAIAEAAGEVGWTDRAAPLLTAATEGPFVDPANAARVALVTAMELAPVDPALAITAVEAVIDHPDADEQTRTHALWIGAHLDRNAGRLARAVARLEAARELVDEGMEPEIAARVDAALDVIRGGGQQGEA